MSGIQTSEIIRFFLFSCTVCIFALCVRFVCRDFLEYLKYKKSRDFSSNENKSKLFLTELEKIYNILKTPENAVNIRKTLESVSRCRNFEAFLKTFGRFGAERDALKTARQAEKEAVKDLDSWKIDNEKKQ